MGFREWTQGIVHGSKSLFPFPHESYCWPWSRCFYFNFLRNSYTGILYSHHFHLSSHLDLLPLLSLRFMTSFVWLLMLYIHSTHISFRVTHVHMGLWLTAWDWIVCVDPLSILAIQPSTKDSGNFAEEGAERVSESEALDFCCKTMSSRHGLELYPWNLNNIAA